MSGHPALQNALRDLGALCPRSKELYIECQGSSIGTYSSSWLNEFYHSACGTLQEWFRLKARYPRGGMPLPQHMKILFPSLRTVHDSVAGLQGGGTMFCREKQWLGKTFPRELFHDSKSKRGGILMHSKMILGLFKSIAPLSDQAPSSNDRTVGGWCYIGSHNFTPSAWGNISGSATDPVLNVTNFELGICFALSSRDVNAEASEIVCWERPATRYRPGIDEPWMQDKHML